MGGDKMYKTTGTGPGGRSSETLSAKMRKCPGITSRPSLRARGTFGILRVVVVPFPRACTHARTYVYILTLARPGTPFLCLARRRSPDADAKQQIYDDEDRVLNFATSNSFSVAGVIGVVVLLFLFVVVIGPPPSDGRCSLPWCG